MNFLIVIPARYDSSRFPGKPLELIDGLPMIIHVCRRIEKTRYPFVVATDSVKIKVKVEEYGYKAVLTSVLHKSGTERVEEAKRLLNSNADVIINVQGDEPFIDPRQIEEIINLFNRYPDTQIASLIRKIDKNSKFQQLEDPNIVKVTFSDNFEALYFSRNIIPYVRNIDKSKWISINDFYSHIGIYAYRTEILSRIVKLPESSLEKAEKLEQLRWLQNGFKIKLAFSEYPTIGIDTPADIEMAERYLKSKKSEK